MASYSISYNKSSITFTVSGLSNSPEKAHFYLRQTNSSQAIIDSDNQYISATNPSRTYANLSLAPNTEYACNVALYPGDVKTWIGRQDFILSKWSWNSSEKRNKAYTAITSQGLLTDFSYTVWNELVDKVKEIEVWQEVPWKNDYLSYESTKMSSADKTMTANRFMSLEHNISYYLEETPISVQKGDKVLGSYFITLANQINRWIDKL